MKNIEFKWAAQLVKEHRDISWRYGVKLTTPTINISSGKKTLGLWSDKNKTFSISSYLIKNEFWDIVLEVLINTLRRGGCPMKFSQKDCLPSCRHIWNFFILKKS
ncbi:MAG: hypothetical protein K8S13_00965 [Desulfobacula sp.]|uniref:hypothetical protein n=1 Tax=Desulfobacula sp. TaxID=2593537 RepID=UPI0025C679F6|nr:hypothetical protein [Desulfobacula sp.]MCD4718419.1 hypothetical protein [Desulfobacula sp.]